MRPICIDFAPASPATARARLAGWGVLALAAAMGLSAAAIRSWQVADDAIQESRARVAEAAPAPSPPAKDKRPDAQSRLTQTQAELLRDAVVRLNRPWNTLFDGMERASRGALALLEVRVDARTGRIRGSAEARHSDAMLAFVDALGHQEGFSEARLLRHEVNSSDVNNPVGFDFEVRWRGAP